MYAIFERAATIDPDAKAAVPLVNFVIDVPTLERYLAGTGDADRCRPIRVNGVAKPSSGIPIPPSDVVAAMIWGQVRRVVVDSAGVVINMGRRQRLFRGNARQADPAAIEPLCGRRVCDTDPTLRSRPPHRMGSPRTHRRRQRGTGVWPPQPVEELRLPRPPRRTRLLAHLPTRRHRNRLTAHQPESCGRPSSSCRARVLGKLGRSVSSGGSPEVPDGRNPHRAGRPELGTGGATRRP